MANGTRVQGLRVEMPARNQIYAPESFDVLLVLEKLSSKPADSSRRTEGCMGGVS